MDLLHIYLLTLPLKLPSISCSFFLLFEFNAEICGINKQENYNPVFRAQTKKILVSFDGRMVCLDFLVSVLSLCFLNLWSCGGLVTYFLLSYLEMSCAAGRDWITRAPATQWYQCCSLLCQ